MDNLTRRQVMKLVVTGAIATIASWVLAWKGQARAAQDEPNPATVQGGNDILLPQSGSLGQIREYTYDANGRLLAVTDSMGPATTYTFTPGP